MPSNGACCDYCGLPASSARGEAGEPSYCCFGCRFAADVALQSGSDAVVSRPALRLALAIFFCMNVMATALPLWAPDAFGLEEGAAGRQAGLLTDLLRYLGLLFTIPVLVLLAPPLVEDAAAELRRRRLGSSTLLTLGVTGAFVYSLGALAWGERHVYFETTCMLLASAALGRYFEAIARHRAGESLRDLESLAPEHVRLVDGPNFLAEVRTVPLAELAAGDLVQVRPGERIPADGVVRFGRAAVDERIVTGESRGAEKAPGDAVWAGSLAVDGDLLVEATQPADGGALARLAAAVESALAAQGPWRHAADRTAGWFLPVVFGVAAVAFAVPAAGGDVRDGAMRALAATVVACPCALALATPLAVWAAISAAARRGVLFRGGDALAKLAAAADLFFDKTGTLTVDEPRLASRWTAPGESSARAAQIALALARRSAHPLCRALVRSLDVESRDDVLDGYHVRTSPGRGVIAESTTGRRMLLGGRRLLAEFDIPDSGGEEGTSTALVIDERIVARFYFLEELRPEASETVAAVRDLGLQVELLSGDSGARAGAVGEMLAIRATGELSPEEKFAVVRERQALGRVAVMVGDGLNDAPALAAADVGIALGCGADLSRESAGVCLLANDLRSLVDAIDTARQTQRVVQGNLLWAFGYNALGLVLAAGGWLSPLLAAPLMAVSSAVVIQRSLRLAGVEPSNSPIRRREESVNKPATPVVQVALAK